MYNQIEWRKHKSSGVEYQIHCTIFGVLDLCAFSWAAGESGMGCSGTGEYLWRVRDLLRLFCVKARCDLNKEKWQVGSFVMTNFGLSNIVIVPWHMSILVRYGFVHTIDSWQLETQKENYPLESMQESNNISWLNCVTRGWISGL